MSARATDKARTASHGQDRLAGSRPAETQAAVSMLRAAALPGRRLYNTRPCLSELVSTAIPPTQPTTRGGVCDTR